MSLIEPFNLSPQYKYELSSWETDECHRFYVQQRRLNCSFMEIMDLWLRAPYCEDCIHSRPFEDERPPDIMPDAWEVDLAINVSRTVLEQCKKELQADPLYAIICKRCGKALRPWGDDDIYVVSYHLEEHYGIPLETPGRKKPSPWLKQQIRKLYDNKCFACGVSDPAHHIDHIVPQSKGGDAAFRNLQLLCRTCGNKKGNQSPMEVVVYNDIYFGPYPSDGYEGLFW